MNQKETELVRCLLSQSVPIRGKDLAETLKISPRSVKNYVHNINESYGQRVILSSRAGYKISPQASDLVTSGNMSERDELPQTAQERISYILRELIGSHTKSLELFELSNELCVGYSTIRALITRMNSSFAPYHVRFVTRSDVLMMDGTEQDKRRFISTVINEGLAGSITRLETLDAYFEHVDIRRLHDVIRQTFRTHRYYLNDFSELNLILHTAIIVDRTLSGNQLSPTSAEMPETTERERPFLDDLFASIEGNFGIALGSLDRAEIVMLVKSNASLGISSLEGEFAELLGSEIVDLTNELVDEVSAHFLVDLSSEAFKVAFASHLKNLLFRMFNGRVVQNPLGQSVKANYPVVFDIGAFIALDLMRRYHVVIDEGETALLAMHVGAEIERQNANRTKVPAVLLCPDYLDLTTRVMNELMISLGNQLDITHITHSQMGLQELVDQKTEMALVLSTIPMSMPLPCRTMTLLPFELQQQMGEINAVLLGIQEERRAEELRFNFSCYCEKDLFVTVPAVRTRDEALTLLCNKLRLKGYVGPNFERDVKDRELAASTGFGSIAIPHSAQMDAAKTSIAVAVSREGIDWDGSKVHLVLLMAINSMDRQFFRTLYESLINLFADEDVVARVQACTSYDEFVALVLALVAGV